MKFKDLFTKKSTETATSEQAPPVASNAHLNLDALDDCVGGRAETEGVGCYALSTQPRLH
jgi:hypothetical protein